MAFRRERSLPACEGWNDAKYEEVMRYVVQEHVTGTLTGSFGPLAKDSYQVSCAGLTRSFGLAETIIDCGQVSGVVHSVRLENAILNLIRDQPKLMGNNDSAQRLAHEFANHVVAILKVLRTMHAEERVFESHTAWSKRFPKTGRIRKSLNGTDVFVLQRILNKLSPGGSSPTDSPGKQDSSEPHAPAEAAHGDDFKKVSVRAEEMSRSDEDAGDRRESGTVEEYDALKGVGYIKPDRDGGFLGWSRIAFCRPAGLMPFLRVGDKVTYEKAMMFGGGVEALRLQLPYKGRGFHGESAATFPLRAEEADAAQVAVNNSRDGRLAVEDIEATGLLE